MLFVAFLLIGMISIVVARNQQVMVVQPIPLRIDDNESIYQRRDY